MELKGKKVLVTGGAGFIGSHLVDALIREGSNVCVIDNLINGKIENLSQHKGNKQFRLIIGSIIDSKALSESMDSVDIVFHLACLGVRHSLKHPFKNHRTNAEGTLLVLEEAYKKRIEKFIYCSSSEVYGSAEYVPMPESHPTHPFTVYGASKLAGEAYARAYFKRYGLKTIIIRPFNTYGPRSHHEGDAGEMIPKSIVRALNREPLLLFGDGSQTRDYTYVEDIAKGLIRAAECEKLIGETFNLGSNFEISIKQIAENILKLTGNTSAGLKYFPNRPADVMRLYANSTAFSDITNWQPEVRLEEGISKTIAWFKSRPESLQALLKQEKGINWQ